MLLAVAQDEPFRDVPDRHLAEPRVHTDLGPVGVGQCREPVEPRTKPIVDAGEQHAQRQGSITGDQADPGRVVRHPAEGHGRAAIALEDPLQLTEPEREHLRHVGEDLARSPRCLGLRAEGRGQWPRFSGGHTSSQGRVGAAGIGKAVQLGAGLGHRHGRKCRMPGVRCSH